VRFVIALDSEDADFQVSPLWPGVREILRQPRRSE
jgi:hypothetical protein